MQTISNQGDLNYAAGARVSPDGRYVVVSAFQSRTVVLFERDPASGMLELSHVARDKVDGVQGLNMAIDVAISPDSQFIYVIALSSAALTVFRIVMREIWSS